MCTTDKAVATFRLFKRKLATSGQHRKKEAADHDRAVPRNRTLEMPTCLGKTSLLDTPFWNGAREASGEGMPGEDAGPCLPCGREDTAQKTVQGQHGLVAPRQCGSHNDIALCMPLGLCDGSDSAKSFRRWPVLWDTDATSAGHIIKSRSGKVTHLVEFLLVRTHVSCHSGGTGGPFAEHTPFVLGLRGKETQGVAVAPVRQWPWPLRSMRPPVHSAVWGAQRANDLS